MEYYSGSGNKILIAHFPGETKTDKDNAKLLKTLSKRMINKPDNIGIVCVITKDQIANSPLINQLNINGYSYYNSLDNHDVVWKPERKILHVLNSLKICNEEYALVLDGNDVAILSDLDNIVDLFHSYNKKIIYNATIWMYPHTIIELIENRGQYGQYCYLNAGCAFGKTSDLINFYQEAWDIVRTEPYPAESEQYYIRKLFDKHQEQVFFDWQCKIFQCWHKQKYKREDNKCFLL